MRIIAVSDLHMAAESCRNIPGITTADLLIACGDLTNYGKQGDAKRLLDTLLSINPNLLAVFGNLDHPEINDYLEELGLNLHGQARLLHNRLCLVGLGGSNPTPFATPGEYSEQELARLLEQGFTQASRFCTLAGASQQRIPTILVSHPPPYATAVDRLRNGRHVGARSVRAAIEKYQPHLCLTGHIHEARGEDQIGKTRIYNPGMASQGGWTEILFNPPQLTATLR